MKIRVRDVTLRQPDHVEEDLERYLRTIHLRFANGIHVQTSIYTCRACHDGGLPAPHELHWNSEDVPGEELIDEFGTLAHGETVERVASELASGKAVRLFIFNSDADLCFQEVLERGPETVDPPSPPAVDTREASPPHASKPSSTLPSKLALGSLIVPIAFAIRALVRFQGQEAEHAASEARFNQAVDESQARQLLAGQIGVDRDTQGCIDWAMSNCHPGDGDCQLCMDALRGCLATAKLSSSVCAEIPRYAATLPPAEEDAAMAWQKSQSAKYGLTHWTCSAMFKFVQLHCHPLVP